MRTRTRPLHRIRRVTDYSDNMALPIIVACSAFFALITLLVILAPAGVIR
jgi:ABC-type microcin C transport system permease subunit YejB